MCSKRRMNVWRSSPPARLRAGGTSFGCVFGSCLIGEAYAYGTKDDFWRRNRDAVKALNTHAKDFNPHYPTCVAYTPLARPVLESFLIQRGLMSKPRRRSDLFHSGFLNKLYLRLNETVFHDTSRVCIPFAFTIMTFPLIVLCRQSCSTTVAVGMSSR